MKRKYDSEEEIPPEATQGVRYHYGYRTDCTDSLGSVLRKMDSLARILLVVADHSKQKGLGKGPCFAINVAKQIETDEDFLLLAGNNPSYDFSQEKEFLMLLKEYAINSDAQNKDNILRNSYNIFTQNLTRKFGQDAEQISNLLSEENAQKLHLLIQEWQAGKTPQIAKDLYNFFKDVQKRDDKLKEIYFSDPGVASSSDEKWKSGQEKFDNFFNKYFREIRDLYKILDFLKNPPQDEDSEIFLNVIKGLEREKILTPQDAAIAENLHAEIFIANLCKHYNLNEVSSDIYKYIGIGKLSCPSCYTFLMQYVAVNYPEFQDRFLVRGSHDAKQKIQNSVLVEKKDSIGVSLSDASRFSSALDESTNGLRQKYPETNCFKTKNSALSDSDEEDGWSQESIPERQPTLRDLQKSFRFFKLKNKQELELFGAEFATLFSKADSDHQLKFWKFVLPKIVGSDAYFRDNLAKIMLATSLEIFTEIVNLNVFSRLSKTSNGTLLKEFMENCIHNLEEENQPSSEGEDCLVSDEDGKENFDSGLFKGVVKIMGKEAFYSSAQSCGMQIDEEDRPSPLTELQEDAPRFAKKVFSSMMAGECPEPAD